jgi:hypothetical protein
VELYSGFDRTKNIRSKLALHCNSRIQPPTQMNTLTLPDFHSVRVLLCIENGEIVGKRMLDSDELIMSRKRFISYVKEPYIGFNDIVQLIELPNSVNERIRVQVRNIQ